MLNSSINKLWNQAHIRSLIELSVTIKPHIMRGYFFSFSPLSTLLCYCILIFCYVSVTLACTLFVLTNNNIELSDSIGLFSFRNEGSGY